LTINPKEHTQNPEVIMEKYNTVPYIMGVEGKKKNPNIPNLHIMLMKQN
jgi:hypothetical protein